MSTFHLSTALRHCIYLQTLTALALAAHTSPHPPCPPSRLSVFLVILFSSSFSHPHSFPMVKLSLLPWDKDKSQLQAGTSFTPTLTGHVRTSVPSMSVFRHLKSQDSAASQTQAPNYHPLMVLCLSSSSFLDSVIHGGSSDNPLYVIHTVDNIAQSP